MFEGRTLTVNDSPLNEAQRRRLLSNAQYADQLLANIESILAASESRTIFPNYIADLTPAQEQLIRNSIARFRQHLGRVLEGVGVVHKGPSLGALHSIRVTLSFIRIAVQEMAPRYLRGYGELDRQIEPQLQGLCAELEGLVERLDAALAGGASADLQARLQRLGNTSGEVELLALLERIIGDHGLVELRPRLTTILERMESSQFEIAVFGRVSAGKSSLLNHILETSILPVGVNPITAVPTRLVHQAPASLTVSFADRRVEHLPVERLPEFVSEIHNPANVKGVVRLVAGLPSPRLRNGLVFVDTPGLGSLATSGAIQTLAYLPQCDLGVVLISSSSPLNDEDLATIRLLYEAAIPVQVLLSKADLLAPPELESVRAYAAAQIRSHLGVEIEVRPVSTAASHASLLDHWFSEEIAPLYEKHQQLARESVRRKTGALGEAVEAALRAKLNQSAAGPTLRRERLISLERSLREAAGKLEEARSSCLRTSDQIRGLAPRALEAASEALLAVWTGGAQDDAAPAAAVTEAIMLTAGLAESIYTHLEQLARTLAASLLRAAEDLGSHDAPPEEELLEPLREMPRFDPPALAISGRPWILYPRALAKRWIRRSLRAANDQPLAEAFNTYGRLMENWIRKARAELKLRFDASADAYRAQLARLSPQGVVPDGQRSAIEADLALLTQMSGRRETLVQNSTAGGVQT